MSELNNQWTNIKESMDALLATVNLSPTNISAKDQEITSSKKKVSFELLEECAELREEKHDSDSEIEYDTEEELKNMIDTLRNSIPKHSISKSIFKTVYLLATISAKDQEITSLKERIELLEECAELLREEKHDSDSEIEYDTEEELKNMIDTLRNSIPKHSISKSIFKTVRSLLQDALTDIKETPLYLVYRYIVVEHLPDTRHQEYEIHGHMYVITDTYIYQLCIYQNGHPVINRNFKYAHFKINAFGIKINGIDKIGFAPIETTKINLSSLLSAKEYFMKSERYLGKSTKAFHELQPLYKKMERFRDLLPMMLFD